MRKLIEFGPTSARFSIPCKYAIVLSGKDPVMPSADTLPDIAASRPKATDWFWRSLYAKLWRAAIVLYWAAKVGSPASSALDQFYTSALAGFLNVAFFPPLALMVLGMGFARAWFAWSDWEFVEPTHEQMFPRKSVSGLSDPYSDPLDPRSGMLHWRHFHPKR